MNIKLPREVKFILNKLHKESQKAYVVGGCCRDSLLGKTPKDWDITTSAKPEQVIELFRSLNYNVIETGLKHGTVTVIVHEMHIEITTFRVDGEYSDNRRPDEVIFVSSLKEDLSRRDFTINALAYNEEEGLIDLFGGKEDLKNGVIRCVGNANHRFQEDALRMLRAVRFAGRLNFDIEKETMVAILDNAELIKNVSAERIQAEFNQIIFHPKGLRTLLRTKLMRNIIPEFNVCMFCDQNNPYHIYDVGNHIMASVDAMDGDLHLKLTMFLHDIAKPIVKTTGEDGFDHFYSHNTLGSDMAETILKRLKYDNETIKKVKELVLFHDSEIQDNIKSVKKWLNKVGVDTFLDLIQVRQADISAQNPSKYKDRMDKLDRIIDLLNQIADEKQCFSIKDLDINGKDLIALGYKEGKEIGETLNYILEYVIEFPHMNKKDILTVFLKKGVI